MKYMILSISKNNTKSQVLKSSLLMYAFILLSYTSFAQINNNSNTLSNYSSSTGSGNTGSGFYSFSTGTGNTTTGLSSVAIGSQNTASGIYGVTIGYKNKATGTSSTCLGSFSEARGLYSTAIGRNVEATSTYSMVLGAGTSAKLKNNIYNSLMIGFNSDVATLFVGPGSGNGTIGKVGIGTTSPQTTLDVNGTFKYTDGNQGLGKVLVSDATGKASWQTLAGMNGGNTVFTDLDVLNRIKIGANSLYLGSNNGGIDNYIYTDAGALRINANEGQTVIQNTEINPNGGKVAIGTTTNDPTYGFHPSNSLYRTLIKDNLLISGNNGIIGFSSNNTPNYHGDNGMCLEVRPNGHPHFPSSTAPFRGLNFFRGYANGQDRPNGNFDLFISSNAHNAGYVGIGTPYPKSRLNISSNASELVFAVTRSSSDEDVFRVMGDGHVWATELDLKVKEDFPDYVFAKDYALMPLEELEYYIEKNKHLPNIPSAEEVANDGLNVGEMQIKQMEKIEELTLYLLEIKQELESVKKNNAKIQQENKELKQLILQK